MEDEQLGEIASATCFITSAWDAYEILMARESNHKGAARKNCHQDTEQWGELTGKGGSSSDMYYIEIEKITTSLHQKDEERRKDQEPCGGIAPKQKEHSQGGKQRMRPGLQLPSRKCGNDQWRPYVPQGMKHADTWVERFVQFLFPSFFFMME